MASFQCSSSNYNYLNTVALSSSMVILDEQTQRYYLQASILMRKTKFQEETNKMKMKDNEF